MHFLYRVQVISVAAPLLACPQEPVQVRIREQAMPLVEPDAARTFLALRLVDGIRGTPLAGAAAFAIAEQKHPLPGAFVHDGAAIADADGFVQVPRSAPWVMARAQGFGPAMDMDKSDRVVALAPGLDVPVRFEDWRGVPLAGYLVGFCGGCGHTCDLATAITDGDGMAVLAGIDPGNNIADVYLANAPITFDYDDVRWEPGAPPVRQSYGPGAVLHGTVLTADGTPAAHAILGSPVKHRGPWAMADEHGRFVLGGVTQNGGLEVEYRGSRVEFDVGHESPCVLRLPVPNGEPMVDGDPVPAGPIGIVRWSLRRQDGAPVTAAVTAVGPLPDCRRRHHAEGSELQLPAGHYQLEVRAADCATLRRTITIAGGTADELALELAPLPTARIAVTDLPQGGEVHLATPDGARDVTAAVRDGTPIAIDASVDYCLRLEADDQCRKFPVSGAALLLGQPAFRWYRPTAVVGLLVDATGAPVTAELALLDELPHSDIDRLGAGFDPRTLPTATAVGRVDLALEREGLAWLWLRPQEARLRPRLVPVPLPWRGDSRRVDLGRIEFATAPALRLHAADGSPLRRPVALLRSGGGAEFREHRFHLAALADDGSWIGPDLRPGDGLLVPEDDEPQPSADGVATVRLPLRHVFEGVAGETATMPTASLVLDLVDDHGTPLPAATVLLRECMWPAAGRLAIRQVPAGEQRLFLGSAGHRTVVVDVRVAAGERRELRIVLPR